MISASLSAWDSTSPSSFSLPATARDVIVGNSDIVDAVVRYKEHRIPVCPQAPARPTFSSSMPNGQQILALDLEVALDTTAHPQDDQSHVAGQPDHG